MIDRLPTQEIIDQARQAVEEAAQAVPAVKGVTYAIVDDEYIGAVQFSDGSRYEVDFNVLDPQELTEGMVAPTFVARSTMGEMDLRQFRGKNVVLYFYPKDNTSG